MITGIIVALPEELGTLTSKQIEKGRYVSISNTLLVAYSGTGPQNAKTTAELLVADGATQLISWGCAAGLSPSVKPGDLVVADCVIDAEGNEIAVPGHWQRYTANMLTQQLCVNPAEVFSGSLAESRTLVGGSSDKKQLHSKTGAIALDMESAAIAKVAGFYKLGFLAIRAVADPVTLDLPKAVSYSLNDQGDIVLGKLFRFLAMHPRELPDLIKLGLHFNKAKRTLKTVSNHLASIIDFDGSLA